MSNFIFLYLAISFAIFCSAIASQDIPRFKRNILMDLVVILIFSHYGSIFTSVFCPFVLIVLALDLVGYVLVKVDS